jgi:hypothetical protein
MPTAVFETIADTIELCLPSWYYPGRFDGFDLRPWLLPRTPQSAMQM